MEDDINQKPVVSNNNVVEKIIYSSAYKNNIMKRLALGFLLFFLLPVANLSAQQKEVTLYNGPAPGSESWNWNEAVSDSNVSKTKLVYNVTRPTLTVFAPDSMSSTGTGVVICPVHSCLLL